jgi:hypothetical protein
MIASRHLVGPEQCRDRRLVAFELRIELEAQWLSERELLGIPPLVRAPVAPPRNEGKRASVPAW